MSLAMAPPTVMSRVPGVMGNQPRGTSHSMRSCRLVPARAVTTPRSRSAAMMPDSAVASSTRPPAFWAASPYARPRPRATTPRAGAARTNRSASPSFSGVERCARVGAVPPHPSRRASSPGSTCGSGDIEADGDDDDPERGEGLQRTVTEDHVLRRAALALFHEQRVAEERQHERHDRDLEPHDAGAVHLGVERPEAVRDHRDARGDGAHVAEVLHRIVLEGGPMPGSVDAELQVLGVTLARDHEERAEAADHDEPDRDADVDGDRAGDEAEHEAGRDEPEVDDGHVLEPDRVGGGQCDVDPDH